MSVGERLKAVRDWFGDSQRSMSRRLKIGANVWALYERDGRLPNYDALKELAELGFSIDWLVTGNGSMRVDSDPANDQVVKKQDLSKTDITEEFQLISKDDIPAKDIEEAIFRKRPKPRFDIPENIKLSIYSLCIFLEAGQISYPAALVIARHIADSIEAELENKKSLDNDNQISAPTSTSN